MVSRFQEVNLDLIEGGKFMEDCDREFAKIQNELIKHARKYSSDAGRSATLTIEVKICEKDGMFAIQSSCKTKIPGRPTVTTTAIADELQTGEFGLFAQSTGTNSGSPHQRMIDDENLNE